MRVNPYTYVSAYAAAGLLSIIVPIAGGLMGVIITANLMDELFTNPPSKPECDCTALGCMSLSCSYPDCEIKVDRHGVWRPEAETGLELLTPRGCKCHERLGNDFWHLPEGQCLYPKNKDCKYDQR